MKISGNWNVLTLKQTVILLILFSVDNTVLSYFISDELNEFYLNFEILRVIIVENIFYKFLVPLYLLIDSRSKLPLLWADEEQRKLKFFMTAPSFISRPVITKYQPSNWTEGSSCPRNKSRIQVSEAQGQHLQPSTSRHSSHHVVYVRRSFVSVHIHD